MWVTPSADGRLLAIGVGHLDVAAVVVLPADGGEARELVRQARGWLAPIAFTPDGRHLIYAARRLPPDDRPPLVLYRVPVAGGEPERLELAVDRGPIRVRPDGRRVAFVRDKSLTEIWAV